MIDSVHRSILFLLCFILAGALLPADAGAQQARSVGYSLAPRISYVQWDDALGLQNDWLWGAAFDFDLGSRVRLSPYFLTRTGLSADPAEVSGAPTFPSADVLDVDTRQYGVDLDIDLTDGRIAPFLRLGGGVLHVDPASADRLDRVTLTYGGGLRFGLERANIEVSAANTTFRLSPERLYTPGADFTGPEDKQSNLVLDTRVTLPLSDMPDDRSSGILGASGSFGLYGGQQRFDLPAGHTDQNLFGVRAGASFSDLLTLSGFYWRGVNDDFDATEDMQGYGAEARFDLGTGSGLSPFLIAGGGRLDFADAGADAAATQPADQTALILGGGLGFRLTDRVNLNVAARDYLLDPSNMLGDVSDPSSLRSNWQYSGGLSIQVGGARASKPENARTSMATAAEDTTDRPSERTANVRPASSGESAPEEDSVRRSREREVVTLPVLDEGTIYIHFGKGSAITGPGSTQREPISRVELHDIIESELEQAHMSAADATDSTGDTAEEPTPSVGKATAAGTEALEQRLSAIERQLQQLSAELAARPTTQVAPTTEERAAQAMPAVSATPDRRNAFDRMVDWNTWDTRTYGGMNLQNRTQAVLGARFDFGPLEVGSPLRFTPELALGFGEGDPTLLAMGNVQYTLGLFGNRNFAPYFVAGAGFYSPTVLGVNTGIGVSADFMVNRSNPIRAFAEWDGINIFNRNRVLVGISLTR